ncbi:MAG TPA: PAN domain-containing protein [Alphaproteobacteria bacterium]|jgi:hypothetical protein
MKHVRAPASALGLAFGLLFAPIADAQQPRASTLEAGVYIEFGPSFVDYQNIESPERCRDLCLQDRRCRVWRYVSGRAPAEYGRARRVCVLGDRPVQNRLRPGTWATSGAVQ